MSRIINVGELSLTISKRRGRNNPGASGNNSFWDFTATNIIQQAADDGVAPAAGDKPPPAGPPMQLRAGNQSGQ